MKTAMQELIDDIRFTDKECYATMFNEGIFKIALEKEKEQIIKAYKDYHNLGHIYGLDTEEYYKEKYSQNKETLEEWKAKFTHHCAIKTNQNK
jgi:hypothetical protein